LPNPARKIFLLINSDVGHLPFKVNANHHSLSAVRLLTVPPTVKALAKLPLASAPVTTLAVTMLARELVTAQDPLSNAIQAVAVGEGIVRELEIVARTTAIVARAGAVEAGEFV